MKTTPIPFRSFSLALFAAGILQVRAETVLELDFSNFDDSTRTTKAEETRPEASPHLVASESDSILAPQAANDLPSGNTSLQKGYFEASAGPEGGGFLETKSTTGGAAGDAAYLRYTKARAGFGTCTVAIVFQPNFANALSGASPAQRACLFATNYRGTAPEGILFVINKHLTLSFGIGTAASAQRSVSVEQPSWDPSKWYFLAASWSPSRKPTVYWKEIGGLGVKFAEGSEPLADIPASINHTVRLGNSGNKSNLGGENPMRGKMAYLRWTDSYSDTQEVFDALYQEIVKPQ